MFNPMIDIDRRIEDLQRLKNQYSNQTQPINIYNNTNANQNEFKAQFLNDNERAEDFPVSCRTCFISLKNKHIAIKELNGDITRYEIVIPKTEEQLRIEELEKKVQEYESIFNNANNEIERSKCDDTKSSKK